MKNLYVRDLVTREIVNTVPVSNPSPTSLQKIIRGMLINMNTDKYFVDDSEFDKPSGSSGWQEYGDRD